MTASFVRLAAACLGVLALTLGAAAARAQPIMIDAQVLEQKVAEGARVVDVRAADKYAAGHIPGAVNLPWTSLNIDKADGVRIEFVSDETLAAAFGGAGLSYDDTIVIVDETALAGRGFVAFDYAGFPTVHVLDGGMKAWSGALSTDAVQVAATPFALERKREIRVHKDYVQSRIGAEGVTIIDGRNQEGYDKGRIPSATLLFPVTTIDESGRYRDPATLRAMLTGAQASPDREVISYCSTGLMAANNYLTMRDLGYQNVVLYDEGWDEWKRDPAQIEK
jgi:3-mercaptopyruvate sulfurtransferase SseA